MTEEVWKPISGFEGLYEVSNFGRVRRIDCDPYRYLKFGYAGRGYSQVHLYGLLGKKRDAYVHRLVAEAFLENPRNCEQVNHIDGNKKNNHVSNLEWCTNQENQIHAIKLGLRVSLKGQDNPAAKLTEEQVLDLIHDLLNHVPYSQICKKYNCSKSTVAAIKAKRNWRYLTENIDFD